MNTKLTLNLNRTVIKRAKDYAKNNSMSLSKLIENYLSSLVNSEKEIKPKVSPLVESLTGVVPDENKNDYEAGYRDYLSEKYS
jgi:hypothetical protein